MSGPRIVHISFEDILVSKDTAQLNAWLEEALYMAADIKSQIDAEREMDTADADWESRAMSAFVAFKRTAAKCKARLEILGFYDADAFEKRGHEIARLNKTIANQKVALATLERKVAALTGVQVAA